VLKERADSETRVAATPETGKKLIGLGLTVTIETGAGLAVRPPRPKERKFIPRGALLIATVGVHGNPELVKSSAGAGIDTAAMELLPRITCAQAMDVLSSQANLAGYRAVIEGANAFERGFAMMMTAAGTVPPARVFIVGAGVAGLQAIATARRLGAIVSATDVRPAAKDEIRSLGATFVGVEDAETATQTGAYAKEMTAEFRQKQAELMATTVAKNDIVITTALVMGRKALWSSSPPPWWKR
jgi:NAD(P) transhydrogenase subunit alpha